MKSFVALVGLLAVGAAEARITVYRNQDVLAKTLASPTLEKALSGNASVSGDTLQLYSANLIEATVDSTVGTGNTSYDQKLTYEVKAQSGRTYHCAIAATTLVTIKTSPQGITYSELSDPRTGSLRCR